MNLAEIAQRVGEVIDHEPDLVRYKREVRARVDNNYSGLVVDRTWSWLARQSPLIALADLEIPNANLVLFPAGERSFLISASFLEGELYPALDAGAAIQMQSLMVGGELDLVDRSLRNLGSGNWERAPFVVEQVIPDATTVQFYADPRCTVTAIAADVGAFVLRFPRILLPPDVDQVTAVLDEEENPLEALTVEQATARYIRQRPENERSAGRPVAYTVDDGAGIRFPPTLNPQAFLNPTGSTLSPDFYQRANLPIREDPPFAAALAAGGNLLANTRYRVHVSWWYAGRFGPPSKVIEVTTTSANKTIELTSLPSLDGIHYGRQLAVFVAEGDTGPFILDGFQILRTDTTRTLAERPDGLTTPWASVRFDEVYPGGPYQYIRLWPKTDTLREIRVRYQARPRRLLSDNDEPEFRGTFHEYLVWATAADIASKHGSAASAARWTAKAEKWLGRLTAHYQPEPRFTHQKGQVGALNGHADPRWPFRNITIDGG